MIEPRLEDDCRGFEFDSEKAACSEVMGRRLDHLAAFNFGRTVQRIESRRQNAWRCVACLLIGLLVGAAGSRLYSDHLSPVVTHRLLTRANQLTRMVEQTSGWRPQ
jgi:hypothetical protein